MPALVLGMNAEEVAVVDAVDGPVLRDPLADAAECLDGIGGDGLLAAVVVDGPLLGVAVANRAARGVSPGPHSGHGGRAQTHLVVMPCLPELLVAAIGLGEPATEAGGHCRACVGVLIGPASEVMPLGVDAVGGMVADDALAPGLRVHMLDQRPPQLAHIAQPGLGGHGGAQHAAGLIAAVDLARCAVGHHLVGVLLHPPVRRDEAHHEDEVGLGIGGEEGAEHLVSDGEVILPRRGPQGACGDVRNERVDTGITEVGELPSPGLAHRVDGAAVHHHRSWVVIDEERRGAIVLAEGGAGGLFVCKLLSGSEDALAPAVDGRHLLGADAELGVEDGHVAPGAGEGGAQHLGRLPRGVVEAGAGPAVGSGLLRPPRAVCRDGYGWSAVERQDQPRQQAGDAHGVAHLHPQRVAARHEECREVVALGAALNLDGLDGALSVDEELLAIVGGHPQLRGLRRRRQLEAPAEVPILVDALDAGHLRVPDPLGRRVLGQCDRCVQAREQQGDERGHVRGLLDGVWRAVDKSTPSRRRPVCPPREPVRESQGPRLPNGSSPPVPLADTAQDEGEYDTGDERWALRAILVCSATRRRHRAPRPRGGVLRRSVDSLACRLPGKDCLPSGRNMG